MCKDLFFTCNVTHVTTVIRSRVGLEVNTHLGLFSSLLSQAAFVSKLGRKSRGVCVITNPELACTHPWLFLTLCWETRQLSHDVRFQKATCLARVWLAS